MNCGKTAIIVGSRSARTNSHNQGAAAEAHQTAPGTAPTVAEALLVQAEALERQAATLRALASSLSAANDDLLTAKQALETFGIGRDGLLAAELRGELTLTRGSRNRILVERAALETYVRRPHAPTRPRRPKQAPPESLAAWDREAERELRLLAGGRSR